MKSLRYILGLIALVALFTACSKDSEMFTPFQDLQENTEKRGDDATGNKPGGKPGNGESTGESLPFNEDGTVVEDDGGEPDTDGISDDDDDESDDDTATRSKGSN